MVGAGRLALADLRNVGESRYGGASTAAAFLKKFIGPYPWAHVDIAGTAYNIRKSYNPRRGATGVGVRLLAQFLLDWVGRRE